MGSMLVAHHFLERDFALGFSNSKPMFTFLKNFWQAKNFTRGWKFWFVIARTRFQALLNYKTNYDNKIATTQ